MELIAYALAPQDGSPGASTIRTLNLSMNSNIKTFGIKMLAPALSTNNSLLSLDLSSCKLGVSGAQSVFENLA